MPSFRPAICFLAPFRFGSSQRLNFEEKEGPRHKICQLHSTIDPKALPSMAKAGEGAGWSVAEENDMILPVHGHFTGSVGVEPLCSYSRVAIVLLSYLSARCCEDWSWWE
ncbi:uncharacterized protein PV09_06952 [Verruconis gallopava]|uniref:Uncharacterized protein n=1 Tax=Verruconis gallopava TaxID=253628 RepID=A0A0D2A5G0_9PEZI|nr:uncharacterized protein PV09_06952 [Verruconis gallopava]KIW01780.1 hypothetical protein PV09_06952 [Verruconis gallopava]